MSIKLYQRYYIRALFKNNEAVDKFTVIERFNLKFGSDIKFLLNDNDINYEKSRAIKIDDTDLEALIKNLNKEFDNFLYKTIDVNYEIIYYDKRRKTNSKINKEEKIIFFGTKTMYENFNNKEIKQFFIDITYKIIPNKYKPYKLLTIKGFNTKEFQILLCGLICIKYEDTKSLYYAFKYLKDFFNFNPKIVNIDFSLSLSNALSSPELFDEKPIITKCFFHFSQSLFKKMKQIGYKSENNKNIFMTLKNIEILCFIKPELINKYLLFLNNIMKNDKKDKLLLDYIENYWLNNRVYKDFNYYDFIKNVKNEIGLKFLFITNNIIESFHGKIEKYLPKGKTTSKGFILSMSKILKEYELPKICIKRHDYKTRTLINIANDYNEGKKFRWYNYSEYKNIEKEVIKNLNKNINEDSLEGIIVDINNLDENDKGNKSINSNVLNIDENNSDFSLEEDEKNYNENILEKIGFNYENDSNNRLISLIEHDNFIDSIEGENSKNEIDNKKNENITSKTFKRLTYPKKKRNYNECAKNDKNKILPKILFNKRFKSKP